MLRILAVAAALAGPTVDLPAVFEDDLARIGPKTSVPILLPQRMPDEFDDYFPTGLRRASAAGTWSSAAVQRLRRRDGLLHRVVLRQARRDAVGPEADQLARGRVGRFKPLSCGGSCAPPTIEWSERGATYRIEAKVGTEATERRVLRRMANSAIRKGPR